MKRHILGVSLFGCPFSLSLIRGLIFGTASNSVLLGGQSGLFSLDEEASWLSIGDSLPLDCDLGCFKEIILCTMLVALGKLELGIL